MVYNIQDIETTKVPIADDWIKKMKYIFYNCILLSHIKEKMLPLSAIWKNLENIMLSEISQRKTNNVISFVCVI